MGQSQVRRLLLVVLFASGLAGAVLTAAAASAGSSPASAPVGGTSGAKLLVANAGPQWSELSPAQQQALKPLAGKWSTLSDLQRRKWIALAQNFGSMPPAEQAKLQSRMTEWASLSMQQRDQARVNFAQAKAIPPDERQEKWRRYQELSPAEKAALASKAKATPKGAAPAIKPTTSSQITVVPKRPRSSRAAASAPSGHLQPPAAARPLPASAAGAAAPVASAASAAP